MYICVYAEVEEKFGREIVASGFEMRSFLTSSDLMVLSSSSSSGNKYISSGCSIKARQLDEDESDVSWTYPEDILEQQQQQQQNSFCSGDKQLRYIKYIQ